MVLGSKETVPTNSLYQPEASFDSEIHGNHGYVVIAKNPDAYDNDWYYKLYNPWGSYAYVKLDQLAELFDSFFVLESM
jgi:hypothetical protein